MSETETKDTESKLEETVDKAVSHLSSAIRTQMTLAYVDTMTELFEKSDEPEKQCSRVKAELEEVLKLILSVHVEANVMPETDPRFPTLQRRLAAVRDKNAANLNFTQIRSLFIDKAIRPVHLQTLAKSLFLMINESTSVAREATLKPQQDQVIELLGNEALPLGKAFALLVIVASDHARMAIYDAIFVREFRKATGRFPDKLTEEYSS